MYLLMETHDCISNTVRAIFEEPGHGTDSNPCPKSPATKTSTVTITKKVWYIIDTQTSSKRSKKAIHPVRRSSASLKPLCCTRTASTRTTPAAAPSPRYPSPIGGTAPHAVAGAPCSHPARCRRAASPSRRSLRRWPRAATRSSQGFRGRSARSRGVVGLRKHQASNSDFRRSRYVPPMTRVACSLVRFASGSKV